MNLKNDLLLRAARGEKTERTPVWLMRQAGRVLPEYREVRRQANGFKNLVETPELAAEVTIQPVDILGVDAAIIFSDILVIPEAMGLPYQMVESTGPWFENTVQTSSDIDKLKVAGADDLKYVTEAIRITKKELNGRVPLIGFAGAPWTILSYMIEGKGSKTFSKAKKFLYTEPALSHKLLDKITKSTVEYLKAQIKAGADIVQIFDSWAGVLSPTHYSEFAARYIEEICSQIKEVPVTVFAKGAFFARKTFAEGACSVIGLDWNMDPAESRSIIGNDKTLQGNMDPCLLYSSYETIETETKAMLKAFGTERYIANLGHGLYPDIEKEKVKFFIDTVKNFRHS
ncbi:MAG: uroporphyrinogen decarboxylase [Bacteroidetes bacterium]|nr:MAG: uroporphyrinogen decarboxylase [Bacteroidota bacterium]REK06656.1 MAG: uroporphyrinogen decarboxylase [Bacteroidota bacterium]REK33422.1 MAG: uroporphyrinogen decarboxylase [Bacteroidota bacterium]REK49821.1 MAG: uroporphyrinogen decarboxylase [Bacteroidota bacterium]